MYGDSQLWYKIASANGLSAGASLAEGTSLTLPAGLTRNSNRADTTRPYNPAEAIGDLSPTTPAPGQGAKCGVFGKILLAIVAVAVTAFTAGQAGPYVAAGYAALTGASAAAGTIGAAVVTATTSAIAGAVGSAVSQGIGVATGIQDKFSFKQVGLAALRNVINPVTFGGGQGFSLKSISKAFARGAIRNAAHQGFRTLTGQQDKFSFKGVATAALNNVASSGGLEGGFPGGGIAATADAISDGINAPQESFDNGPRFSSPSGLTPQGHRLAETGQISFFDGGDPPAPRSHEVQPAQAPPPAPVVDQRSFLAGDFAEFDTSFRFDNPVFTATSDQSRLTDRQALSVLGSTLLLDRNQRNLYLVGLGSRAIYDTARAVEFAAGLTIILNPIGAADSYQTLGSGIVSASSAIGNGIKENPIGSAWNVAQLSLNPAGFLGEKIGSFIGNGIKSEAIAAGQLIATDDGIFTSFHAGYNSPITAGLATSFVPVGATAQGARTGFTAFRAGVVDETLRGTIAPLGNNFGLGSTAFNLRVNPSAIHNGGFLKTSRPSTHPLEAVARLRDGQIFGNEGANIASRFAFNGPSTTNLAIRPFDDFGNLLDMVVLDSAGLLSNGRLRALEFKLSKDSPFTPNQDIGFPNLDRNGGVVVGQKGDALGLSAGDIIDPLEVEVFRGPFLPRPEDF